ncbi:MAG: TetR/AcrR family transcriptional regulator, partial [Bryobacteraceae bacterium]|nr:TetR/AcrR family transcriptional regulator [Bryobacteraceae bacterium]
MQKTGQRTRREIKGSKSGQRVESLLHVAHEVFSEKGFERTTTLEIARRLDISEATVFSYFGSKRELCIEVVRRWYEEISSELERELPGIEGIRSQLLFTVRKHLHNLMGKGTGLCALILSEGRVADEAFVEIIADLKRRYTAPLMKALEVARTNGELRHDVPLRLFRDMVYGSMEHVLWDRIATGRQPDIEESALQLTTLLCDAFVQRDTSEQVLVRFHADVLKA